MSSYQETNKLRNEYRKLTPEDIKADPSINAAADAVFALQTAMNRIVDNKSYNELLRIGILCDIMKGDNIPAKYYDAKRALQDAVENRMRHMLWQETIHGISRYEEAYVTGDWTDANRRMRERDLADLAAFEAESAKNDENPNV